MTESNIVNRWKSCSPQLRSVLRIVTALIFMMVGTMKLFSWPIGMPPAMGPLKLFSLIGIAGILEVFGGALFLIGLWTRPIAFILAGEMAVAYFYGHAPHGLWPIINGGSDAILDCFIFLYFSAAGAGPWSVDAMRGKP